MHLILYFYFMKKLIIINGPNLNLLGKREPNVYGNLSFTEFLDTIKNKYSNVSLEYFQSNVEGELISKIQDVGFDYDGIILNAAAYTHTSIAILDALKMFKGIVIEVHITNIHAREEFRHHSFISKVAQGVIAGFGEESYLMAIDYLYKLNNKKA